MLPEEHRNRFPDLSSSGLASLADLSERMTTERLRDDWPTAATVRAIVAAEHRLMLPLWSQQAEPGNQCRRRSETEKKPRSAPEALRCIVPGSVSMDGWQLERAVQDIH